MQRTSDYDYTLPAELIAQEPAIERTASRALYTHRCGDECELGIFAQLSEHLQGDECFVVNDSRVIPARLRLQRETGGRVEAFLLRRESQGRWRAWLSPSRRIKEGEALRSVADPDAPQVTVLERAGEFWRLDLGPDDADLISRIGEIPLPPYITRTPHDPRLVKLDGERYQTVFAREPGAVAAPTAGLHFSRELLDTLAQSRIPVIPVTLHVGPGTFRPISVDRIEDHHVDTELYEVSQTSRHALNQAHREGRRIIAVGTTSLRVLESLPDLSATEPLEGETSITIVPGHKFRHVDGLVTNFHLPRSSLLVLVSAFHGYDRTRRCYQRAIDAQMRFYSYGDAMVILPAEGTC